MQHKYINNVLANNFILFNLCISNIYNSYITFYTNIVVVSSTDKFDANVCV